MTTYRDEIEKRDFRTGSFVQISFSVKHLPRGFCFRYETKQKHFNLPNFFIRCSFIALCNCHEEMTSFQDFTFSIGKTEASQC